MNKNIIHTTLLLFTLILLFPRSIYAQDFFTLDIGKDGSYVNNFIQQIVQDHNRFSTDSFFQYSTNYSDGKLSDVVLCSVNTNDSYKDYCKHFIIQKDKFVFSLTQYNASTQELNEKYLHEESWIKCDKYFINIDYKHYIEIYLSQNNKATIKCGLIKDLPSLKQDIIQKVIAELNKKEQLRQVGELEEINQAKAEEMKRTKQDSIYHETVCDVEPFFKGGEYELNNYLKQIKYPMLARENGITGKVFMDITIDTLGNVIDYNILRSLGAGCDEEALRVVKLIPNNWNPGQLKGKSVVSHFTFPINFSLK